MWLWRFRLVSIAVLLSVVQASSNTKSWNENIHVALHAQVSPSQGFIVGSVITTAGLAEAFRSREEVSVAEVFYPFEYEDLHKLGPWDLVIIEGWFEMINAFIHEVRALSPGVLVLFYCLDPDYPGLSIIEALDVDGYLTNSQMAVGHLEKFAPTQFVLLGVASNMRCDEAQAERYTDLHDKVVFVGSAVGMSTKVLLPGMLHEAMPFGLRIYGRGWGEFPEFSPYWGGTLPQEDLCCVYRHAWAILGVTMDAQREAGMINNRVFEALACQGGSGGSSSSNSTSTNSHRRFITEHFPELEKVFGEHIRYARAPGDVEKHLRDLKGEEAVQVCKQDAGLVDMIARDEFLSHHTYDSRVKQIWNFVKEKVNTGDPRKGAFRVTVLVDDAILVGAEFAMTLGPALLELQSSNTYNINMFSWSSKPADAELDSYDFLWAVSDWQGPVDKFMRSLPPPPLSSRHLPQSRALFLFTHAERSEKVTPPLPPFPYDLVYYRYEWEREGLEALNFRHLQHAYGVKLKEGRGEGGGKSTYVFGGKHSTYVMTGNPQENISIHSADVVVCLDQKGGGLFRIRSKEGDHVYSLEEKAESLWEVFRHSYEVGFDSGIEHAWVLVGAGIAGAENIKNVRLVREDQRLIQLLQHWPYVWDVQYYSKRIRDGVTRVLCLGRGKSHVNIVSPLNQTIVYTSTVEIETDFTDFRTGRDGLWCLILCGKLLVCLQLHELSLTLKLQGPYTKPMIVEIYAELHSNMYSNVFTRSRPVYLFVIPEDKRDACEIGNVTTVGRVEYVVDVEGACAGYG